MFRKLAAYHARAEQRNSARYDGLRKTKLDPSNSSRLRAVNSRQNASVKELRQAFHSGSLTEDGYCAIEGMHLLEEAIRSGLRFKTVFFGQAATDRANKLLPQLASHVETLLLPDEVFASAVQTESPQGVAALVKLKSFKFDDLLRADSPLLLGVAGLQDPGNLGTILRSAEAFGVNGVFIGERSVAPWNPKVVRGSSGSVFRLPIVKTETQSALLALRERGVKIWATSSHKGTPLQEADFSGASAILIGNEGSGLSREVMQQVDETLVIPHSSRVESLNAGIAASIVVYEAARQRGISR